MVLLAIHVAARDGDLVALRRELAEGVSPNAPTRPHGLKPLHLLCGWQNVNAALPAARAGGDLPLALAIGFGASARRRECIALLLRAGAAVNPPATRPLGKAWLNPSLYPILLRAGATLHPIPAHPDPYLAKILAAGGFRGNGFQNYERARRHAINAIFIPKFAHVLPPELVRRVVEFYWLHAPYY